MTKAHSVDLPRFWPLFAIALAMRVLVVCVGLALATQGSYVFPVDDPVPMALRDRIQAGSARVIEPWFRWDAGWYVSIGTNGYKQSADLSGLNGVAFLPALPLCFAAADALGINPFWAVLVLVNLLTSAGMAVFARVAVRLTGDRALGLRAFVLLLAFPSSFFFSAPYNEAFGLLFTALALSAWLQDQSVRAGLFASLVSMARMTGVALGVAALGAWLLEDRGRQGFRRAVILAAGSFLGLALFWSYLGWAVGDPFAGLKAQKTWGRHEFSIWNPWLSFRNIYDPRLYRQFGDPIANLEVIAAMGFLLLGIRAWFKRGAFWGILTMVPTGQMMMSGSFLSAHRLVLAALPAFIEMADLLRNRTVFRLVIAVFVFLQFFLLNRYVHWIMAG